MYIIKIWKSCDSWKEMLVKILSDWQEVEMFADGSSIEKSTEAEGIWKFLGKDGVTNNIVYNPVLLKQWAGNSRYWTGLERFYNKEGIFDEKFFREICKDRII